MSRSRIAICSAVFVVLCLAAWFWPTAETPSTAADGKGQESPTLDGGPRSISAATAVAVSSTNGESKPSRAQLSDMSNAQLKRLREKLTAALVAEMGRGAPRTITPLTKTVRAHVTRTIEELGTEEFPIKPAETFYFHNGEYLTQTYILESEGYALFLNGVKAFRHPAMRFVHHPTLGDGYQEKLLPIPEQLNSKSTWNEVEDIEVEGKPWHSQNFRWFFSHHPPKEALEKFIAAVRKYPFVKSAELVFDEFYRQEFLRVTDRQGNERHYLAPWFDPKDRIEEGFLTFYALRFQDRRPYSADEVRETIHKRAAVHHKILESGNVVFSTSGVGGEFIGHDEPEWINIVTVVAILKSDASNKLKSHEIYPRVIDKFDWLDDDFSRSRSNDWAIVKRLVRNFKGHPQLDERIAKLKKEHNIPDWKQPPEPPQPKVPDKLKNDPRLTPEGTVRAALQVMEARNFQEYIDHYQKPFRSGKQQTVQQFTQTDYPQRLTILLRHIQNDKPVIDDIDDTCYFAVDAEKFKGTVARGKFPLRKIGPLWLIGY